MVGRDAELRELLDAHAVSVGGRRPRLVTVVGEAGVGKSRLIDELVGAVRDDVTFLRGRCLPYGDGITFWPLAEAVRQAAGIAERDALDTRPEKLCALVSDGEVVDRVASAIGLSRRRFPSRSSCGERGGCSRRSRRPARQSSSSTTSTGRSRRSSS